MLKFRKRWYTRLMDRYRFSDRHMPGLPLAIRLSFRTLFCLERARIAVLYPTPASRARAWHSIAEHDIFFGFGLYRSGTSFLAALLSEHYPHVATKHEANVFDYLAYSSALRQPGTASKYLARYRLPELHNRLSRTKTMGYGEVNPFLRRHAAAIRELLPNARLFTIVRDGRRVVRSLMAREFFRPYDPMAPLVRPPDNDPFRAQWHTMTRFEKVCWMWATDNAFLLMHAPHVVRLEDLVTDYDYFTTNVTEYLGLPPLPPDTWFAATQAHVNPTPVNAAKEQMPWGSREKEAFEAICGTMQERLGYSDRISFDGR